MAGAAGSEKESLWYSFTQQRLKAWQPVLDPKWVISGYLAIGAIFVVLGGFLLKTSQGVEELSQDYTDIVSRTQTGSQVGTFTLPVMRDMEPPIWIYYQLDGFHQNHRRYVKSRDDVQMSDAEQDDDGPRIDSGDLPLCSPWVTTGSRVNYPCGLVARSVFNDSFHIRHLSPDEGAQWEVLDVNNSAKTIAWAADTSGKFQNLDPEATHHDSVKNEAALNMWINTRFPPQTCEQTVVSDEKPWRPAYAKTKQVTATDKDGNEVQAEATDCSGFMGTPLCSFQRRNDAGEMQDLECTGDYERKAVENWGIESGHFIVWMRIAGLPSFRKLWGRVDTALKANTTLNISFADNFPVVGFHGRKAFVISTSSVLGGRNDFLGYGYIVVGAVCVIFGLVYFYRHSMKPRNPGDLSLLVDPPRQ